MVGAMTNDAGKTPATLVPRSAVEHIANPGLCCPDTRNQLARELAQLYETADAVATADQPECFTISGMVGMLLVVLCLCCGISMMAWAMELQNWFTGCALVAGLTLTSALRVWSLSHTYVPRMRASLVEAGILDRPPLDDESIQAFTTRRSDLLALKCNIWSALILPWTFELYVSRVPDIFAAVEAAKAKRPWNSVSTWTRPENFELAQLERSLQDRTSDFIVTEIRTACTEFRACRAQHLSAQLVRLRFWLEELKRLNFTPHISDALLKDAEDSLAHAFHAGVKALPTTEDAAVAGHPAQGTSFNMPGPATVPHVADTGAGLHFGFVKVTGLQRNALLNGVYGIVVGQCAGSGGESRNEVQLLEQDGRMSHRHLVKIRPDNLEAVSVVDLQATFAFQSVAMALVHQRQRRTIGSTRSSQPLRRHAALKRCLAAERQLDRVRKWHAAEQRAQLVREEQQQRRQAAAEMRKREEQYQGAGDNIAPHDATAHIGRGRNPKARAKAREAAVRGDIEVSCRLCGTSIKQRSLKQHIKQHCQSRMLQCRESCCRDWFPAWTLEQHKAELCGACRVTCEVCQAVVKQSELDAHMSSECLLRVVCCPNENRNCPWTGTPLELDDHFTLCGFELVSCAWCFTETLRVDLDTHACSEVSGDDCCVVCLSSFDTLSGSGILPALLLAGARRGCAHTSTCTVCARRLSMQSPKCPLCRKCYDSVESLPSWLLVRSPGETTLPPLRAAVAVVGESRVKLELPQSSGIVPGTRSLLSPLEIRFTHDSIGENFKPFRTHGFEHHVSILDSAEELIHARSLPRELEVIDVVIHKGETYVAGTFNRRLCMYRLFTMYFPERFGRIKIRYLDKQKLGQKYWDARFTTKCEGRLVEVRCTGCRQRRIVGQTLAEVSWPEAHALFSRCQFG